MKDKELEDRISTLEKAILQIQEWILKHGGIKG